MGKQGKQHRQRIHQATRNKPDNQSKNSAETTPSEPKDAEFEEVMRSTKQTTREVVSSFDFQDLLKLEIDETKSELEKSRDYHGRLWEFCQEKTLAPDGTTWSKPLESAPIYRTFARHIEGTPRMPPTPPTSPAPTDSDESDNIFASDEEYKPTVKSQHKNDDPSQDDEGYPEEDKKLRDVLLASGNMISLISDTCHE